jgi:hypothetical protein
LYTQPRREAREELPPLLLALLRVVPRARSAPRLVDGVHDAQQVRVQRVDEGLRPCSHVFAFVSGSKEINAAQIRALSLEKGTIVSK